MRRIPRASSILLTVLLASGLAVGVATADVYEGLVAHWALDESEGTTAEDSSGNGHDGTLNGDPQWVAGHLNGALEFDGVGDEVEVPYSADLNPADVFTVAAWARADSGRSGHGAVISCRDDYPQRGFIIYAEPGNTWQFWIGIGTGWNSVQGPSIRLDEWVHLAAVYSEGTQRFYVDGEFVGESSGTLSVNPQQELLIGAGANETATHDYFFQGPIDEVRLYNRVLSDEEIVEVMNWSGGAYAGPDQWAEAGQTVTLSGSGPDDATSFTWEQIIVGDEPAVTLADPNSAVTTFTAPVREIGYILTFRLTVESPTAGTTSDECLVTVTAPNEPKLVPQNFRTYPGHLSYRLEWDRLIDATEYGVGFKLGENQYFWFWTTETYYDLLNLQEGSATIVAVVARNSYGEGPRSDDITLVPMRNYALPDTLGGTEPPSDYVYVISYEPISRLNNTLVEDDTNDSWDGSYKAEDYWGYLWPEPILMDQVVYFTGDMWSSGGWFQDLKVQYTKDGTSWIDVPTTIVPLYDFTDDRAGRETYQRFDMEIPTLLGTGVRIYGMPGGTATFTSIAELQVLADHVTARPLVVQGVDAEVPERNTATLDGSFTFSTRGDIQSYSWTQLSGTSVTINNATSVLATFDAHGVDADEDLVFRLTASDGTDTLSDEEVTITVKNLMTTAVAGPDQSVEEGASVILDGLASVTTTGALTYQWSQTSGNPVTLNNAISATADFEAPVIWDYAEALVFQLEVNDGAGGVSTDEVTVHVLNSALLLGLGQPLGTSWVQDVLVLGENYESRILSTATNEDQLAVVGGQANVTPLPGDTVDLSGTGYDSSETPLVWTPMHRDDGWWFDNRSGRGCVQDNFIGYFHLYVISLAEQEARLHYGNDDDMRGWNNGELILSVGCCTGDSASGPFTLSAGINSMTFKVTEYGGDNYMAVRFTDRYNRPLTGLYYSLSVPIPPSQAYAVRELPTSYEAGGTVEVTLSMRVNPDDKPSGVTISEPIPAGLTVVDAGGGTQVGGSLNWSFSGGTVATQVLSYTLGVPAGTSGGLDFTGTVAFEGTTENILGDNIVYETPSAPQNVSVETLIMAHLYWTPSPEEGVTGYKVYRSVNGGDWEEYATASGTSYADKWIEEGSTYNYQVSAVNSMGEEGPLSDPTGEKMITIQVREAEDFNYGGGLWPWNTSVTVAAVEASAADDLTGTDYWHPNTGGPGDRSYRPLDNTSAGLGIETIAEVDNPTFDHTNIGWIDVGSWYRYTFDIPAPGPGDPEGGWIRLSFRVACPNGGTLAAYWDEVLVGTVSYVTGNYHIFTEVVMEAQVQTSPGIHTLRVESVAGELNLDKIGVEDNAPKPTREDLFADDFESYSTLYSSADLVAVGYAVNNGAGVPEGAWRLWNTAGDDLGAELPDIAAMTNNYVITDSDLGGAVDHDEELITPNIDCTNHRQVRLDFNMNYRPYLDDTEHLQIAEVDIRSSDDGLIWGDWVNLLRWDTSTATDIVSGSEQVDISAYADGKVIQVRWHYYEANFDYWFAVDDIRVSGDALPPSKGEILTLGYVTGVADLTWNAFGDGNYTVQYTADLTSDNWQSVPGVTWPITDLNWSGDISGIVGQGVYLRVRSE